VSKASPSLLRQQWLEKATDALRQLFARKDYEVPQAVRVSVGWPKGSHGKGRAIGQCWGYEGSTDKHNEIFISPEITTPRNSVQVLGVLAHELAHATVGIAAGHKAAFKRCAEAVGLEGPMTATTEGAEFRQWAAGVIDRIGQIPAGGLSAVTRKKQGTRLLKCECGDCGYTVRVTRKWVESAGEPICPTDKVSMACDAIDDEDSEDA
jgi:hypothetical protein